LEVSSPGVERPLRTLEHFEAHVGKKVEAVLIERHHDRKHGVGVIKQVEKNPGEILLETNRGEWSFPIEKLSSCRLKFDWQ
jgi:ribosome maturation factor RimP